MRLGSSRSRVLGWEIWEIEEDAMSGNGPGRAEKLSVDHIGIAVTDLQEARERFEKLLGVEPSEIEEVPSEKVRVSFFDLGGTRIELFESTEDDSSIHGFLERRQQAVHHIALRIDGSPIAETFSRLRAAGLPVLGDGPSPGSHDSEVFFVHPRGSGGTLFEFTQPRDARSSSE